MLEFALYASAEINESPSIPMFGQDKISRHGSQEVTYLLHLALMEWERKAIKAQASRQLFFFY